MINTLNIPTARRLKKDKQFCDGNITMYPCHSLLYIYYVKIIFRSGSTWKSRSETTQSIRDPQTWKDEILYIFHQKINFLIEIDIQRPNSFEVFNILLYCITRIIYTIVIYSNSFSVIFFLLHGHHDFNRSRIWS